MEEGQLSGQSALCGECLVVTAAAAPVPFVVTMRRPVSQQRARDNRAAQRINKVHVCAEPPKRAQQPPQPPPQPLRGLHDCVCPEAADPAPQDPLRPRESEQEQEWKLRQVRSPARA